MNYDDEHSLPEPIEPLDENLSQLICSENLPPVPDDLVKAKMLDALLKKQANLVLEDSQKGARWSYLLTGLAAMVMVGFGWFFLSHQKAPNQLVETQPVIVVPVVVEELSYDAAENTIRIELRDGSVAIAEQGTRFVEVAPRYLKLETGSLYLVVEKAEQPLVVETSQGKALALGTRFLVSSEDADTKVAVAQGRVQLVNAEDEQVEVLRGEEGLLNEERVTRRAAPRISHLVSWARDHLRESDEWSPTVDGRSGLIAVDSQGQESRLSLREYVVDVFIENGVARTTIDQTFFNHYHANTEGTFYFPLPPGAAVSRLAMYVNGVRNEGGMVERQRGQEIYNDIKYQNRDPALLEQLEGNLYKLRIFPLEGRQEKRLFLSFTQSVDELYRTLRYWLPMDHTQDVAGVVKIKVRIKDGEKLYEAESSTHEFVQSVEEGDLLLSYEAADEKPDQDLLLKLIPKVEDTKLVDTVVLHREERNYLQARIRPVLEGEMMVEPRQWFILNDTSASRSAAELQAQAYVVERLLAEADDEDLVAMANLNVDATPLMEELVSLRDEKAVAAVAMMKSARRVGGTNMEAGILEMRDWVARSRASNPYIVYLGDGLGNDGVVSRRDLTALLDPEIPFLGISMGKKADLSFLREAADVTGGGTYLMNPDEDLNWRVFDLLASLNTPRLTKVTWELGDGVSAYGDRTTVAAGEALTLVMACEGELPKEVTLKGDVAGESWEKVVSLKPTEEEAIFIPRFWAQCHLDELLQEGEKHREEVVRLSQQHYVATPFTSLIVLESDQMYKDYKVEKGRKDHWAAYQTPDKIPVVREPLPWAEELWRGVQEDVEIELEPKTAKGILATLLMSSSSGVEGVALDEGVRRSLYRGEVLYNSGLYDQATTEFRNVLRFDPYNVAARRWLERCHALKSNYYRAAYDATRAQLLREVDRAWSLSVPPIDNDSGDLFIVVNGIIIPDAPNSSVDSVSHIDTAGNRSGAAAISGDSIDAILNMPSPLFAQTRWSRNSGELFGGSSLHELRRDDALFMDASFTNGAILSHQPVFGPLTSMIPGLATLKTDRVSAVEEKFGRKANGSVSPEARELIVATEARRKPVRLSGGIITPDGRVSGRRFVEVYLEEETVADGENWFHIYRELGFATKRSLTSTNRGVIQAMVPHWPPSLEEMEARWQVTLVGQEEGRFEIELVDLEQESQRVRMVISKEGLLLKHSLWNEDEFMSSREFLYEGEFVIVTDHLKKVVKYESVEVEDSEALFRTELEGLVVLDLPLRKPVFYQKQLDLLSKGEHLKKKQLLRHLILSQLVGQGLRNTSQFDELKNESEMLFDLSTLEAAMSFYSVKEDSVDFLKHHQHVMRLFAVASFPPAEMYRFLSNWPDSPYLLKLAEHCSDPYVWEVLLEYPEYRTTAMERLVMVGDRKRNSGVAKILEVDALAGKPRVISHEVAIFLGRDQAKNGSWLKVVSAYQKASEDLESLGLGGVLAILDLALKEKDALLTERCVSFIENLSEQAESQVLLADVFASNGHHQEAVEFYRMAFEVMKNIDAALFNKASLSAKSIDEELSINWQWQAMQALRIQGVKTNKELLLEELVELQERALAAKNIELAKDIALAAYDLLPSEHSLISRMATFFHEEGDTNESWRWLSTIVDLNPKDAEASGAVGDWYAMKAEDLLQAEQFYADAHSFDSAHPQWLLKRVETLYRAGEFKQADIFYRELIATPWAYQLKGLVPLKIEQSLVNSEVVGQLSQSEPKQGWLELDFDDREWDARTLKFTSHPKDSHLWENDFFTRQKFHVENLPRQLILKGWVQDASCEVYLNGSLINKFTGEETSNSSDDSSFVSLTVENLANVKIGENVLAVKYSKTGRRPQACVELVQEFTAPRVKK